MKLIFESQEEKGRVENVAVTASEEARSQFYMHLLSVSTVEGEEPAPVQEEVEEDLVDPNVEQISEPFNN